MPSRKAPATTSVAPWNTTSRESWIGRRSRRPRPAAIASSGIASAVSTARASSIAVFGASYGGYHWWRSVSEGVPTLAGTVMLSAVPLILGLQLILAFLGYDIASVPRRPVWPSRAAMRRST